jgi:hypothetical protein
MSIKVIVEAKKKKNKKKYVPSFYKDKEERAEYLISKGVPEEVAYGVADKQMAKKGKKKKDKRKNEDIETQISDDIQFLQEVDDLLDEKKKKKRKKRKKKKHQPSHKRSKKYFGGYFYDYHMLHGDSSGGDAGDGGGGDGNRRKGKKWTKKRKDNIDCNNPKGFSERAHCDGKKKNEGKDPKVGTGKKPKGSGRRLYTDENPNDTVSVKFATVQDIKDTLSKSSFKSKSHKRQSQIINLIHQRARAAYKNAKDPETKARLKKSFEYAEKRKEESKKKTQRMNKEKKK